MKRTLAILPVFVLTAFVQQTAHAYVFKKIAETGGGVFSFLVSPTINNSGTVAFRAGLTNGHEAIYTNEGGMLQLVADTGGPFQTFGTPVIGDLGTVAFEAGLDNGGASISAHSSGGLVTIAESTGPWQYLGNPTIGDTNTAFFAVGTSGPWEALVAGDGGPLTTLYDTTGALSVFASPSVNSAGTLAFLAGLDSGGAGIFSGSGGTFTTIADGNGPFLPDFGGTVPDINDAGTVAFFAFLDRGGQGIFAGDGAYFTTVVASGGPFETFRSPNINSGGTVAFEVGAGEGIYTGPDAVNDKVIAPGDPLFDSLVSSAYLSGNHSLNDNNEITFFANLADGRQVIAVAQLNPSPVPPPGDFNRDRTVDAADYLIWRKYHGELVEPCSGADANCNGFIDNLDITTWISNFGISTANAGAESAAAIPEPTCVVIVAIGLMFFALRR